MRLVEELFDEGHDLKRFIEGLLWHVHHLILFATLDDPADLVDLLPEERKSLNEQAHKADVLRWHQVFDVLGRTASELARNPFPRLVVETALLRLAVLEPVVAIDELVARVERLAARLGPGGGGAGPGGDRATPPAPRRPPPAQPQGRPQGAPASAPRQAPEQAEAAGEPAPPSQAEKPAQAPGQGLEGLAAWEKLVEFINGQRPSLGSS